jgi:hypothetical protein
MFTRFSSVDVAAIQSLEGNICYNTARKRLTQIKDSLGVERVLICHLAKYWDVPDAEIIAHLSPKKLVKVG